MGALALAGAVGVGALLYASREGAPQVVDIGAPSVATGGQPERAAPEAMIDPGPRYRRGPSPRRVVAGPSGAVAPGTQASPAERSASPAIRSEVGRALQKHVDLTLNQVAVHDVLRVLSEATGTPIVVRGELDETVSLDLRAVTVQDALDETLGAADAVWEEVDLVRVSGGPGAPGPDLGGPRVTVSFDHVDLRDVLDALAEPLDVATSVADDVEAERISLTAEGEPAGRVLQHAVAQAGLRYEVVPAIEVRADDE